MRFQTVVSLVTLLSVLGAATGQTVAAQTAPAPAIGGTASKGANASKATPSATASLKEARRHFALGVELLQMETPNYLEAHQHFAIAHQLSGSWKVLGNLGLCAFKLERYSEALEHYAAYLQEGGDQVSEAERTAVEQETSAIWANSGEVTLTAHGAAHSIEDSRSRSGLPRQVYSVPSKGSLTLRLHAGHHRLVAKTKTGVQVALEVDVVAGEHQTAHFELDQAQQEAEPAPAVPEHTQPPETPWSTTQAWGLGVGAIGAANLLVAMGFGFLALGKDRRGRAQCDFDSATPTCGQEARDDFDEQAQYARTANVLLAVGGVVSLTGVGLILFGGNGASDSAAPADRQALHALELSPYASGHSSGLLVRGQF